MLTIVNPIARRGLRSKIIAEKRLQISCAFKLVWILCGTPSFDRASTAAFPQAKVGVGTRRLMGKEFHAGQEEGVYSR
jgi:hypothetical protein